MGSFLPLYVLRNLFALCPPLRQMRAALCLAAVVALTGGAAAAPNLTRENVLAALASAKVPLAPVVDMPEPVGECRLL